jgi:hypothetical protein
MKEFFEKMNCDRLFDIVLVCGIVILASNNTDGWGWLMLLLFLKN